ncbi:MAG: ComF family protein [Deltaproteobacteria bacterium]|nr:ComF family protein [Deltaproteobacteria bacterium]
MKIVSTLLDIIYPPRCPFCGRFVSSAENRCHPHQVCESCKKALTPITHPLCTICGIPFSALSGPDHPCENCLRKMPSYDTMRAPYLYAGPIMNAIQRFKYNSETHLAAPLGGLLAAFARTSLTQPEEFVTVPVPLHKHRLRERGFNQSLLLAKAVASELGTPLNCLSLIRKRDTRSQTGLRRKERRKNVANAFSVTSAAIFKGKKVLLVDDVLTTGYTLQECARTLKKFGAREVACITLARTVGD